MPKRVASVSLVLVLVALLVASFVLAGCGGETKSTGTGDATTDSTEPGGGDTTDAGGATVEGIAIPGLDQIPDGRTITPVGGGNAEYTFLTLWQKGLEAAQEWRPDAYLVAASGQFVNDDGVPSEWQFVFRAPSAPTATLQMWVDVWGGTSRQETDPDDSSSPTKPITADIMDSDAAITACKTLILDGKDAADLRDPGLGLAWTPDGSQLLWQLTMFDSAHAEYPSVAIDAVTGEQAEVKSAF